MMVAAVIPVLVAACGLLLVRTAAPLARWLAWGAVLAFAAAALQLPAVGWRQHEVAGASAALAGDAVAVRGAVLAAAAAAPPRATGVLVQWRDPAALPAGPFGAAVEMPAALPFQPEDLAVDALAAAAPGRPLPLLVRAVASSAPLTAELRIERLGQLVHTSQVALGPAPVGVAFTPDAAGGHTITLRVVAGPHVVTAQGAFDVVEPASVLVLEPSGLAAAALRAQGVVVAEGAQLPADLLAHAAVVLGMPLPAGDQERLAAAVRDGLGAFVLAPGFAAAGEPVRGILPLRPAPQQPAADGQGGDAPGPGAEAEPVSPPPPTPPRVDEPPRGDTAGASRPSPEPVEVDKRAIAMVIVVDRSGSMGVPLADGRTKMSYAKTSALRTAQALGEGDLVGVVTFGNKDHGRVELPMTDAADAVRVRAGIERLAHAPEMTYLLSGLRQAYEMLAPANAAVKHVVVITDGEFMATEELALRALAHRSREQQKITLSLISIVDSQIGPTFVQAAEGLSRDGGGQFFEVRDPGAVPAFVSAEVTRSLQRVGRKPRAGEGAGEAPPAATEPPKPPKPPPPEPAKPPPQPSPSPPPVAARLPVRAVATSPLLAPAPLAAWPSLGRAIAGTAPLDARVLLVAGDDGWPLLAFGNRGLGRVGAFAADLCGEPGAEFRAEPAFPARFAQWVQGVLPLRPAAPASLLDRFTVAPRAPTPRDVAAMTAFGGAQPVPPGRVGPAAPSFARLAEPTVPAAGPWLVLGLALLVLGERLLAARALRRASA